MCPMALKVTCTITQNSFKQIIKEANSKVEGLVKVRVLKDSNFRAYFQNQKGKTTWALQIMHGLLFLRFLIYLCVFDFWEWCSRFVFVVTMSSCIFSTFVLEVTYLFSFVFCYLYDSTHEMPFVRLLRRDLYWINSTLKKKKRTK